MLKASKRKYSMATEGNKNSSRSTAVAMKNMLENQFPIIDVVLANYPPSPPKRLMSKLISVLQLSPAAQNKPPAATASSIDSNNQWQRRLKGCDFFFFCASRQLLVVFLSPSFTSSCVSEPYTMAKRFNRSRGRKVTGKFNGSRKNGKKPCRIGRQDAQSPTPSALDDVYENHLNTSDDDDGKEDEDEDEELDEEDENEEEDEEIEAYRKPSVYGNLLMKLEASTNPQAKRHMERKGKDEHEGDLREASEYDSESSEDNDLEGASNEAGTNEDDMFDTENGLRNDDGNALPSTSESQSNFGIHIAHKLLKEDVEKLLRQKWKYKWEIPAFESANYKWMGTGECIFKTEAQSDPILHFTEKESGSALGIAVTVLSAVAGWWLLATVVVEKKEPSKDADVAVEAPCGLKLKLYKHWLEVYNSSGGSNFRSSKQRMFFSLCKVNKKTESDSGAGGLEGSEVANWLNHVFQTRDIIAKNDAKLAKHPETAREEVITSSNYLDQGFTRPKVLILLPLASVALRLVRRLVQLAPSGNKVNVEYMERFCNEFGVDAGEEDELEAKQQKPSKPADYQALFGANNNDHFMVGIKFTRYFLSLSIAVIIFVTAMSLLLSKVFLGGVF
ncbi:hypothetical protein Cgig2_025913 [Carnegiea gigantea]|uniref:UTP25 NTP hydrolase-like domain-containing protein n=1 Tax=Carnegiea gigantea TaxID=171969 RepID=A0A9Q1K4E6_9CARY|nr:hypothetical protein Cgig2_025913 [Carnegiea gigantea]